MSRTKEEVTLAMLSTTSASCCAENIGACVGPRSRFRVSDSDSDADVVGAAEAAALLVALVRVAFVDDDAKDNEGNVVVDTGTVE